MKEWTDKEGNERKEPAVRANTVTLVGGKNQPLGPATTEDQKIYDSIAANYSQPVAQARSRAGMLAAAEMERSKGK